MTHRLIILPSTNKVWSSAKDALSDYSQTTALAISLRSAIGPDFGTPRYLK
ncbi:MAG: hypothetical protein WA364_14925 [Candidatus Nitrosopolaris sp.]